MLNELFDLAQSQQQAGITNKESWYGKYKTCPKGMTIRILFDQDSHIKDFEIIRDASQIEAIRKYEPAYGQSFPAFNIKPLFWAKTEESQQKVKDIKKKAKEGKVISNDVIEVINKCLSLWNDSEKKTLVKCLELAKQFQEFVKDIPIEISSVKVLSQRLANILQEKKEGNQKAGITEANRLFDDIKNSAINKIADKDSMEWFDKLLICTTKEAEKAKKISIVCDIYDRSTYPYPPTHEKVQHWINNKLMENNATKIKYDSDTDAYGKEATGSGSKFPPAKLPRLTSVTLRAMNSESPCQKRYGRADAASFCVGQMTRQNMKDSLEWLGKEQRKNLTWRDVSGVCGFTKRDGKNIPVPGILFAYPSIINDNLPPIPTLFAGEEQMSDSDGSGFAAAAKRVIDGLIGIQREKPDVEIRVFVLTKADKARTKLLLSRQYVASRIISAANNWQEGCQNIPPMRINIGTNNKEKAIWINTNIPFPIEVVNCLNTIWFAGGEKVNNDYGMNIGDGLTLLLEEGITLQTVLNKATRLAIENSKTLILALGHSSHRSDGSFKWNKDTAKFSKQANLLPSIMGLLLYKFGIKKGEYMSTAPFLVGQIMSLADTLHKEYCRNVRTRKNDKDQSQETEKGIAGSNGMPRQLIGNSAMAIAMDNPTEGLARLAERILIYQSWANTSQDSSLAGWALNEFRRVSEQIGKMVLPVRCNDADKAQMLLGYLSRIGEEK